MALADTGKAIGAVSEALRERLSTIAGMSVTVGRPEPPDSPPAGKKLNIFLYESQFDASFKNYPLEDGQQPPVWLVLKYLLTAFAPDGATSDNIEAHENLGLGIRALQQLSILHITPGLPSHVIKALKDNPENLHVTFDEAPTELLSKVMMQGDEKYRISVAFQVRPVMIAPAELPSYSLLVGVDYVNSTIIGEDGVQNVVLPSMGPTITEISPLGFEIGDTVTIYGNDLHLSNLSVNLGPVELLPTMQKPDRLEFVVRDDVVTGNVISAGSHAISVGQLLPSGRKRLSNLLVGNLLPTLSSATILAGSLQTVVSPPPPPPPAGWKFATINLTGKLLGQNDKDDFYLALYRNGATVKFFENDPPLEHLKDTSPAGARQTARQCVMVRADAVPPGKYIVLYRVNGQQAVKSAEIDMT